MDGKFLVSGGEVEIRLRAEGSGQVAVGFSSPCGMRVAPQAASDADQVGSMWQTRKCSRWRPRVVVMGDLAKSPGEATRWVAFSLLPRA